MEAPEFRTFSMKVMFYYIVVHQDLIFHLKKKKIHPMVAKKEIDNTETYATSTFLSLLRDWSIPDS